MIVKMKILRILVKNKKPIKFKINFKNLTQNQVMKRFLNIIRFRTNLIRNKTMTLDKDSWTSTTINRLNKSHKKMMDSCNLMIQYPNNLNKMLLPTNNTNTNKETNKVITKINTTIKEETLISKAIISRTILMMTTIFYNLTTTNLVNKIINLNSKMININFCE